MSWTDWAALVVGLGVGGVAGAVAAVVSAGGRLARSFGVFRESFEDYIEGRPDAASQRVRADFDDLTGSVDGVVEAATRLRRALRLR
ncbi:MAG: hypothetical protein SNJ61_09635 [Fimbriimonadaceae bacterium]